MSLGVEPLWFFARLLLWFVVLFAVWLFVGPWYTSVLAVLVELVVSLVDRPTHLWSVGTTIQFWPRGFAVPAQPPSIAAEWIQANTILLMALMAATPAADWHQKLRRLAMALALVLCWQILDVTLAIEFGYATRVDPRAYSDTARYWLAAATNLAMYVDTQVVPFMIWAGLHFQELLGWARRGTPRPTERGRDLHSEERRGFTRRGGHPRGSAH